MCTQILTCEQQSNITCEVIGFFHVWMKLYTLKNYINKIFPHVNWIWRFPHVDAKHGTQNHVKCPYFICEVNKSTNEIHIFKCELNIFQCELFLIVTCEKQTGNFGQSCESNIFTLIYFLKCELWIWKCKKKKTSHVNLKL